VTDNVVKGNLNRATAEGENATISGNKIDGSATSSGRNQAVPDMSFPIANYSSHQHSLVTLLETSCGRPLLFIRGEKDHGKTWLLKWFRTEVGDRCRVIAFDLAARQSLLSPSLILRRCADELGSDSFSSLLREAQVYNRSRSVVIQNVKIDGSHNVVTGDAGETLQEQVLVAFDLTKIFVADLKNLATPHPPIIFIFDHFDEAGSLIKDWLFEGLIPALRAVPHSRLVLAGRQLPPADETPWASATATVTLAGVQDATAWSALVKLLKKIFPLRVQRTPMCFCKGPSCSAKVFPAR
jgi:hypothetical protein